MPFSKFLTVTFIINLAVSSLASQFVQDDILAFPRYKVILTNEKISNANFKDVEVPVSSNSVIMTSASGQPFSCTIPNVQIEQERLEREKEEQAKEETEEDLKATIDRGLDLIEPLGKSCIRFFASTQQYWTYEYCHNQYVRQFHIEHSRDEKIQKEKETASFYLGIYPGTITDAENNKENPQALTYPPKKSSTKAFTTIRTVGDQRYLVQQWENGSVCDLTEKPRTVEVQFHCDKHGQDRVTSFVEVSTCHYQIAVSTSRLCEEMSLSHRHHAESHKIECRPIVSENLIEQEQALKEEEKIRDENKEEEDQKGAMNEDKNEEVKEETKEDVVTNEIIEKMVKDMKEELDDTMPGSDQTTYIMNLISDLKAQVNQIKADLKKKEEKTEISIFTFDKHGNMIPDSDFKQIVNAAKTKQPEQSKDQQENKQAYHQLYL